MKIGRRGASAARLWHDSAPVRPMRIVPLTVFALACAGCSDSSDAPETEVFLQPDIAITVDNANDVAAAAIRAALDLERVVAIGTNFLLTPPPEPTVTPPVGAPAILSVTLNGPEGGTAEFSWEDVLVDGIYSSTDVFTIVLDDYGAEGLVLNGAMVIDSTEVQGTIATGLATWLARAELNLLGVRVGIGSQVWAINTTVPIRFERRQFVQLLDARTIEDVAYGPYEIKRNSTMSRFATEETLTYFHNGAVFSNDLDGLVRYDSPGPLGAFPFFPEPSSGILFVRGFRDSVIELEFGFFTLEVRVDEDGDGEFEQTTSTSLFAFLP